MTTSVQLMSRLFDICDNMNCFKLNPKNVQSFQSYFRILLGLLLKVASDSRILTLNDGSHTSGVV